jgi:hypothetical protein
MKKMSLIFMTIMLMSIVGIAQKNGQRVQSIESPAIYLILDGKKCHIPSEVVYNNLFRNWNNIIKKSEAQINNIPTGQPLSTDATLCLNNGVVWFLNNGKKRHVGSEAAMDKYNFSWEVASRTSCSYDVLKTYPTGRTLD